MYKKLKGLLLFLSGAIVAATVYCFSPSPDLTQHLDTWYKISNDELDPGVFLALDMTQGYSMADEMFIYIVVNEFGAEGNVVITFPNGGYWEATKADEGLLELQKEFDSLENYLKQKGSQEWKKE